MQNTHIFGLSTHERQLFRYHSLGNFSFSELHRLWGGCSLLAEFGGFNDFGYAARELALRKMRRGVLSGSRLTIDLAPKDVR